ncbi:hypothetical protein MY9_2598 [Bacillus sp. JS]|nr:hypothetical protein MY9_2598 [Bacillus sp. JS]
MDLKRVLKWNWQVQQVMKNILKWAEDVVSFVFLRIKYKGNIKSKGF